MIKTHKNHITVFENIISKMNNKLITALLLNRKYIVLLVNPVTLPLFLYEENSINFS